jgi:hypothetical protein
MHARTVSDWLEELANFLNDAAGAHGFSRFGVQLARDLMQNQRRTSTNPDPEVYIELGERHLNPEIYQTWHWNDMPKHLADDGPVMTQIGHQWVVHVYTAWDSHFRPGLERAHSYARGDHLMVQLFGDLRLLRNDIAHSRGIATRPNAGRAEMLKHWIMVGEVILIRGEEVAEFLRLVPWQKLREGSH